MARQDFADNPNAPSLRQLFIDMADDIAGAPQLPPYDLPVSRIELLYDDHGPLASQSPEYRQSDRNWSWDALRTALGFSEYRNLYLNAHGSPFSMGGDYDLIAPNGVVLGAKDGWGSTARLSASDVRKLLRPKGQPLRSHRFVFLDGCSTYGTRWPKAFGIATGLFMNADDFPSSGSRPGALVTWKVDITYNASGPQILIFPAFRQEFIQNWSYTGGFPNRLIFSLERAYNWTGWPDSGLMEWGNFRTEWLGLRGYQHLRYNQFNRRADWPPSTANWKPGDDPQ